MIGRVEDVIEEATGVKNVATPSSGSVLLFIPNKSLSQRVGAEGRPENLVPVLDRRRVVPWHTDEWREVARPTHLGSHLRVACRAVLPLRHRLAWAARRGARLTDGHEVSSPRRVGAIAG